MECPKVLFKGQYSKPYVIPQPTDLFCQAIFFAKFSILTSFSLQFLKLILREHIPPHNFPVEQGHSVPP